MKALTDDDLRLNERATSVAASVLGENVEAACRCEQVTKDQQMAAAGVGGVNRGLMKGMMKMNKAMMPRMGSDMDRMQDGGLPKSFILAVTATGVHALEDKEGGGRVVKSWQREGFTAKQSSNAALESISGVPEDRQLLIIYLPMEGAKTSYMKAAQQHVAASGSAGMPHKVMLARDDASQRVIDLVATQGAAGANIMIGGQSLQSMMGQAGAQADPAEQLTKLADLRDRGVLSDEEFAAQKAKILAG
jgi:hypothetical protein